MTKLHATIVLALSGCVADPVDDVASDEAALATSTVIASGQDTPLGVIVDATNAYWINAINFTQDPYDIASTRKTGGAPVRVLERAIPNAGALSQDAGRLFWPVGATVPHEGGLFSRPKGSGPVTTLIGDLRVFNAAPSGSSIYFVSPDDGGFVARIAKSGGPVTQLATDVGDGLNNIPVIAFSGDRVVFSQSTFEVDCDGRVRTVSKSGGPLTTLVADVCNLFYIAADDGAVYWTESDATTGIGRLMRLQLGHAGAPVVLDTVDGQAMFIALDATSVYYSAALGDGTSVIRRIGKHGHAKATIAAEPTVAFTLALDARFAYWTTPFTGEVKRVLR